VDYQKMKALMEASRGEPAVPGNPSVKELPEPEPRPDWKYLDTAAKERMAA
jgi:hypothetical protein